MCGKSGRQARSIARSLAAVDELCGASWRISNRISLMDPEQPRQADKMTHASLYSHLVHFPSCIPISLSHLSALILRISPVSPLYPQRFFGILRTRTRLNL